MSQWTWCIKLAVISDKVSVVGLFIWLVDLPIILVIFFGFASCFSEEFNFFLLWMNYLIALFPLREEKQLPPLLLHFWFLCTIYVFSILYQHPRWIGNNKWTFTIKIMISNIVPVKQVFLVGILSLKLFN